jgi:hypothetical protein
VLAVHRVSDENEDILKRLEELEETRNFYKLIKTVERMRGKCLSEEQYIILTNSIKKRLPKPINRPRIVRSFREFLLCILDERVGDVLDRFGIAGLLRSDYISFARKCLKDLCDKLYVYRIKVKDKRLAKIIVYNYMMMKPVIHFEEEVYKAVALVLYEILYNIERLKIEYENRCEKEGLPFVYVRRKTSVGSIR